MGARVAYLVAGLAVAACLGALIGCGGGARSIPASARRGAARPSRPASSAAPSTPRPMCSRMTAIDGPGVCGLERPLRVSGLAGGRVGVSPPATIGCPLTAGLDRWIEASVQPAAYRYFGQPRGRASRRSPPMAAAAATAIATATSPSMPSATRSTSPASGWRAATRSPWSRLVAGHAARAGIPPGGVRRRLRGILYRARPGQRPLPLQPHPCRSAGQQRRNGRHFCQPSPGRGVPVAEAPSDPAAPPR